MKKVGDCSAANQKWSNPRHWTSIRIKMIDQRFQHHSKTVSDPIQNKVAGKTCEADDPAPAPVWRPWQIIDGGQVDLLSRSLTTAWDPAVGTLWRNLHFKKKSCLNKRLLLNDVTQIWTFSDPLPPLSHSLGKTLIYLCQKETNSLFVWRHL